MPTVEHHYGNYLIHGRAYGPEGVLVQTDWDYPSTARELGWNMRRVQTGPDGVRHMKRAPNRGYGCNHSGTDGTVRCNDCGITASFFIHAASEYLDSRT